MVILMMLYMWTRVAGPRPAQELLVANEQLPPEQRTAILLVVQQELPYEEIAEIMGVPVSSVKTWIHRARSRLRELLKDFYGNE